MAISLDRINHTRDASRGRGAGTFDPGKWMSQDFKLFKRLKAKDKLSFYEELDLLFDAGLDMENALTLIQSQHKKDSVKERLISGLMSQVVNGKSLSDAMKDSGKFSDYEYYSIKIGEESGNLGAVVANLNMFYTDLVEQKRKLISAVSYPVVVLVVAVAAVYFLLRFVVPLFDDVFNRFDGELPGITRFIISISEKAGTFFPWVVIGLLGSGFLYFTNRKKTAVRKLTSKMVLGIPVIGSVVRTVFLARIFNALSLLTSSRNPLNHSIEMIKKMVGFYPFEISLEKIESEVLKGRNLFECMDEDRLYDKKIVTLIRASEEVGRLEPVLKKISENLSRDIGHKMTNIGSLLEPILILLVGGMVAIILIGMYLPLFSLSTSIY